MTTSEPRDRPNRIANPWMTWLLRSRLHTLISGTTMLITLTGKKTGWRYTIPVDYARDGDSLIVTSRADRMWWRNLRGGAPVELRLRTSDLQGHAEVIEGAAAVSSVLRQAPELSGRFHIKLDAAGQPKDPEQLARFARERVLVRIGELAPRQAAGLAQEVNRG